MVGKKHTVISPAHPSAQRNVGATSSNPKLQPKMASASAAGAMERSAPKPRKSSREKGKPATAKKKRDKTEPQGGTKRKKPQVSGEAATPTKKKKKKRETKLQKQKGAKREKSGETKKPAPAPTKKQQASCGAEKPTPTKRKRGDTEPQKEGKSDKRSSGEGGTRTPTPAKKRKDKAATAAAGADQGACSFPMARVRLLMRAEDASLRPSNEAVFLINKASELFLETFAEGAYHNALKEHKKSIIYDNLSTAVCNQKSYKFLSDFVPQKVAAGDAFKATALKQS